MASPSSSPQHPPAPLPLTAPPQPSQSQSSEHSTSPGSPKPETVLIPAPESKPPSLPRKTQPFPWSTEETLALIEAYREKWYSVNKGPLKAFQWEEVSIGVAARCGLNEPSRTTTQCRHKIEKLRKRYRSELKSRKPVPSSWPYFGLMYQMECGPFPLNVHPITAVEPSSSNANANGTISNIITTRYNNNLVNVSRNYSSLYSGSADCYNNSVGDGGVSDENDEEWSTGYGGADAENKNKPKSINHIVLDNVKKGIRSERRVRIDRGFDGGTDNRFAKMLRDQMTGKRKQYYDNDDEEDDEDKGDDDDEQDIHVDEGADGGGGVGKELAAEIRGFADRFMRMENKKIEIMREKERSRMEMEKKRMEMILEAQRKIVDSIGWAFEACKKSKMTQET